MDKIRTVGLIGVGLMGHGMGHNLLKGGYELRVLAHRRRDRVEDLVSQGAVEKDDIATLVCGADMVLCCLPTVETITEVIGGENGVIAHIGSGAIVVDCSTSTPVLEIGFAERAAARGAGYVDAMLMKGPAQAMEGSLNVIAGGSEADIARIKPVLMTFTAQFFHVGPVGAGCTVKLLNQAIGLGTHAVVTEAFVLGAKLGVDIEVLFNIVNSGQASSEKLKSLSQKFLDHDYSLKFATATGLKDLRLCERMSVDAEGHTPVLNTVIGLFGTNAVMGNAAADVSTLAETVGKLSGIDFLDYAQKK